MNSKEPFKWRHFQKDVILLNVRWYLKYPLSYRNLEEIMLERGLKVDHSTIGRWGLNYSPQIEERTRRHLKLTNDSWKVDETYIKIKGKWKYLYRAVDSQGNTLDFMLSAKRNKQAAKRFFKKVLKAKHNRQTRVINVDKNPAYPPAIEELKLEKILEEKSKTRQVKYLNNLVEQDHRGVKRIINSALGYQSFHTAWRTIKGIETIRMIYKGQVKGVSRNDVLAKKNYRFSFGITI
ncbi:MAG: IS6 family transposase [Pleurocapsa sp. CRU_1_2]|nr:IS6 family transposase [Pleurocapsa sp. CRU_1_2]